MKYYLLFVLVVLVGASTGRLPVTPPSSPSAQEEEHSVGDAADFMEVFWETAVLPSLSSFIEIPNQSPAFDAEWETNGLLDEAAAHILDWSATLNLTGLQTDIIKEAGKPPLVVAEIASFRGGNGNALMYGHYDKQPPMEGWDDGKGPYTPVLENGNLYGRGGADDGYSLYGALAAFAYFQSRGIAHPRAVIIIEGGEESGSVDLDYFLDLLAPTIGTPDLVVCLDSGAGNYDQLFMTTSLRGGVIADVRNDVLTESIHSGTAGGMVTDTLRSFRRFLNKVERAEDGAILLPHFNVEIPEDRVAQAQAYADVIGSGVYDWLPLFDDVAPVSDDAFELVLLRTWKPSLTVTGSDGLPPTTTASNVIRPYTDFRLSFRLPPTANTTAALHALRAAAAAVDDVRSDVVVSLHNEVIFDGWNAAPFPQWLEAVAEASSQAVFGRAALYTGEGGSIPFIGGLQERYPDAGFVVTGVLGPNSNAHGPNEFIKIAYAAKLSAVIVDVLHQLSEN